MVLSPAWCCLESSLCPWAAEMGRRGSSLPPSIFGLCVLCFLPWLTWGLDGLCWTPSLCHKGSSGRTPGLIPPWEVVGIRLLGRLKSRWFCSL